MKLEEYKHELSEMLDAVYELEGLVQLALGKLSDRSTFQRLISGKLDLLNDMFADMREKEGNEPADDRARPDNLEITLREPFVKIEEEERVPEQEEENEPQPDADAKPVAEEEETEAEEELIDVEEEPEVVVREENPEKPKGIPVEPEEDDEPTARTFTELRKKIAEEPSRRRDGVSRMFSINDKFRFKRELFGGSDAAMRMALDNVNRMQSLEDAEDFFYNELQWSPENEDVKAFMKIMERYFG